MCDEDVNLTSIPAKTPAITVNNRHHPRVGQKQLPLQRDDTHTLHGNRTSPKRKNALLISDTWPTKARATTALETVPIKRAERPFDSAMVADLAVWSVKCSVVIN
jgi:hypothetical protein